QGIDGDDLKEIRASFVKDAPTTALQNILTGEADLKKLALNRDLQGQVDHYFKYKVPVKGITDQKQWSTCPCKSRFRARWTIISSTRSRSRGSPTRNV